MIREEFDAHERCAVCGKDADGDRWFCHFYGGQKRITLCSPKCAEKYMRSQETTGVVALTDAWQNEDIPRLVM